MNITCPHCGAHLKAKPEWAGRTAKCTSCDGRIVIPPQTQSHLLSFPEQLPELADPGISSFPQTVSGLRSSETVAQRRRAGPFTVDVSSRFAAHSQSTLDALHSTICHHLKSAGPEVVRQADLHVAVVRWDAGSRFQRYMLPLMAGAARVSIAVAGSINGKWINETVHAARYVGGFGGSSRVMCDACLQECIGKVLSVIDRTAGRKASSFSQVWRNIHVAKWVACAVVCVGYASLYAIVQIPRSRVQNIGFSLFILASATLMASAGVLGIITMASLVIAPTEFLKSDPRGIRAMARAGVKNVIALRMVAVIVGIAAVVVFAASLWGLFDRS
jgi:hypothetical protein